MSRWLIAAVAIAPAIAHAQDAPGAGTDTGGGATANANAPADMSDQAIAAMIGVAGGGRTTPGGLVVAGHYFYQLSDQDWWDGAAAFVFGGGDAECFRDRMNSVICDHGLADGYAGKLEFAVRRFVPALSSDAFWPFVRAGLGAGIERFSDDDTTGIAFFVVGGGGLRASITEDLALSAVIDLQLGLAQFSNGVGGEPQFGIHISAGAEFKL
jgi:hypothetical protein